MCSRELCSVRVVMETKIEREQRYVIHYCYRRELTPAETYREMKNVYGEECFQLRPCERWHQEFKDSQQSMELVPYTGWLASVCTATNVNTISVIIRKDQHLSLLKLEDQTNIPRSSLHRILCDQLKMWRISSTWVCISSLQTTWTPTPPSIRIGYPGLTSTQTSWWV